jgi:p-aminobenzoyl-glutamate transporter AbgT
MKDKVAQTIAAISSTVAAIFLALLSVAGSLPDVKIQNFTLQIEPFIASIAFLALLSAAFIVDAMMDDYSDEKFGKAPRPWRQEYLHRAKVFSGSYLLFCSFFSILSFVMAVVLSDEIIDSVGFVQADIIKSWITFPISLAVAIFVFLKLFSHKSHFVEYLIIPLLTILISVLVKYSLENTLQ